MTQGEAIVAVIGELRVTVENQNAALKVFNEELNSARTIISSLQAQLADLKEKVRIEEARAKVMASSGEQDAC